MRRPRAQGPGPWAVQHCSATSLPLLPPRGGDIVQQRLCHLNAAQGGRTEFSNVSATSCRLRRHCRFSNVPATSCRPEAAVQIQQRLCRIPAATRRQSRFSNVSATPCRLEAAGSARTSVLPTLPPRGGRFSTDISLKSCRFEAAGSARTSVLDLPPRGGRFSNVSASSGPPRGGRFSNVSAVLRTPSGVRQDSV